VYIPAGNLEDPSRAEVVFTDNKSTVLCVMVIFCQPLSSDAFARWAWINANVTYTWLQFTSAGGVSVKNTFSVPTPPALDGAGPKGRPP
jgi:hypothetical protein